MASGILVYIEHVEGKVNRASYEALRAAQLIGAARNEGVSAVLFGAGIEGLAAELATRRLQAVYQVEHEGLSSYTADGVTAAFREVIAQTAPSLIVMSHTYEARDFAPKLAASYERALVGDCTGFQIEGGRLVLTRLIFQGKLAADVVPVGEPPHFVSFQVGTFRGDECEAGSAAITPLSLSLEGSGIRQTPEARFKEAKAAVDLTQAPLIVSVGRGIKDQKNIDLIRKLTEALGAELAASRPICDNDWLPMDRQIGSSGQTVAPKLYLAVGISGAIQHLVGMKGARTIVAINKDREAPIFEVADYGVVGDLFEIVPALTAEAEKSLRG
jgi:electron transfer flavoprotein alpha subunit